MAQESCFVRSNEAYFCGNHTSILRLGHLYSDSGSRRSSAKDKTSIKLPLYLIMKVQHPVKQIAAGNMFFVCLCENNKLYGSGSNQFGQLGFPRTDKQYYSDITEMNVFWSQSAEVINKISVGIAGAFAFVTNEGSLYTSGELSMRQTSCYEIREVSRAFFNDASVIDVSCGGCLSVIVNNKNEVFSCGYDSNAEAQGILGRGKIMNELGLTPHRIDYFSLSDIKIIRCYSGRMHTIVMDVNKSLYGWGANKAGQLGLGNKNDQIHPMKIEISNLVEGDQISSVSCGWYHSLLLTDQKHVYSCGSSTCGMLGRTVSSTEPDSLFCRCPPILNYQCSAVAAGSYSSIVLLKNSIAKDDDVTSLPFASSNVCFAYCGMRRMLTFDGILDGNDCDRNILENFSVFEISSDHENDLPQVSANDSTCLSENVFDGFRGSSSRRNNYQSKQSRNFEIKSSKYDNDNDDDCDDNEGDCDDDDDDNDVDYEDDGYDPYEDENDDFIESIVVNFSSYDFSQNVAHSYFNDTLKILEEQPQWQELVTSSSMFQIIFSDHYGHGRLSCLAQCLESEGTLRWKDRLQGIMFVSTSLVDDHQEIDKFVSVLSTFPNLKEIVLDMSSFYSLLDQEGKSNDEALGYFLAQIVSSIRSIEKIVAPGVDDVALDSLFDSLIVNPSSRLKVLRLDDASFQSSKGAKIAQYLAKNLSVEVILLQKLTYFYCINFPINFVFVFLSTLRPLQELLIGCYSNNGNEFARLLASGLKKNTRLTRLDLHVSELGHIGIEEPGVRSLVQALKSNSRSALYDLDVSGDDGAPEISNKLHKELLEVLKINCRRVKGNMKVAKLPIWRRHEMDD